MFFFDIFQFGYIKFYPFTWIVNSYASNMFEIKVLLVSCLPKR
jgi:hypothetical protein